MRAESIRRLLVLGVCALGVTALYLVPLDPAPAPRSDAPLRGSVASPPSEASSTSSPASQTIDADWSGERQYVVPPGRGGDRAADADNAQQSAGNAARTEKPRTTADVPFGQPEPGDTDPPAAVAAVRLDQATEKTVTLSWPQAVDDVGVTTYRVWLNGYEVATTSRTSATVRWFNNDSDTQIVQVRAVDAAGNQSVRPASLLARRPVPVASETPTAAPADPSTPAPTAAAAAEESPSPGPPSDEATPAPTS